MFTKKTFGRKKLLLLKTPLSKVKKLFFFIISLKTVKNFCFTYDKKQLLPQRVSKGKEFSFVLDLLLLQNEQTYHYVLIINLIKSIAKVKGREYRDRNELCRNCFHVCSSLELLTPHQKVCLENESVQITMPILDKNNVKFENYAARWFSPFVVYLDLESLVVPVATAKNNYFKHFYNRTTSSMQLLHGCC